MMRTQLDLAPTHRKRAAEITAVQWTGRNIEELRKVCGGRFNPLDPVDSGDPRCTAEVLAANGLWVPLPTGEWVVRDPDDTLTVTSDEQLDAEYEALTPAGTHTVTVMQAWRPGFEPMYQVEHPEACHRQRYEQICPFDHLRREVGTAAWPVEPGVYEAVIRSAHCGSPEYDEWDTWIEWTPVVGAGGAS